MGFEFTFYLSIFGQMLNTTIRRIWVLCILIRLGSAKSVLIRLCIKCLAISVHEIVTNNLYNLYDDAVASFFWILWSIMYTPFSFLHGISNVLVVRSILNGLVVFFIAWNRHRLRFTLFFTLFNHSIFWLLIYGARILIYLYNFL